MSEFNVTHLTMVAVNDSYVGMDVGPVGYVGMDVGPVGTLNAEQLIGKTLGTITISKNVGNTEYDLLATISVTHFTTFEVMARDESKIKCEPDCTGKICGDDGCDGICGTCGNEQVCNKVGVCVDACVELPCPCVADCANKQCGDDGCGGECGQCTGGVPCKDGQCVACKVAADCPNDNVCKEGKCQEPCTKSCDGKECGSDGCGGECGDCMPGIPCTDDGQCVACKLDDDCGPQDVCVNGECNLQICEPGTGSCKDAITTQMCNQFGDGYTGDSIVNCVLVHGPNHLCFEGNCKCNPNCEAKDGGEDGCGGDCPPIGAPDCAAPCSTGGVCSNDAAGGNICVYEDCVPVCAAGDSENGCGGSCSPVSKIDNVCPNEIPKAWCSQDGGIAETCFSDGHSETNCSAQGLVCATNLDDPTAPYAYCTQDTGPTCAVQCPAGSECNLLDGGVETCAYIGCKPVCDGTALNGCGGTCTDNKSKEWTIYCNSGAVTAACTGPVFTLSVNCTPTTISITNCQDQGLKCIKQFPGGIPPYSSCEECGAPDCPGIQQCGPNVCGVSCGECPDGFDCKNTICVEVLPQSNCKCDFKPMGYDDGCGNICLDSNCAAISDPANGGCFAKSAGAAPSVIIACDEGLQSPYVVQDCEAADSNSNGECIIEALIPTCQPF